MVENCADGSSSSRCDADWSRPVVRTVFASSPISALATECRVRSRPITLTRSMTGSLTAFHAASAAAEFPVR